MSELAKLVKCEEGGKIAEVDFAEYTLLVVHGVSNCAVDHVDSELIRYKDGKYLLTFKMLNHDIPVIRPWYRAVKVPKLAKNEKINLVVTVRDREYEHMPASDFSLTGTDCSWIFEKKSIEEKDWKGVLHQVNNNEELLPFVTCKGESFPKIDFEKNSLLLAEVLFPDPSYKVMTELSKRTGGYTLYVGIYNFSVTDTQNAVKRTIGLLIPKLEKGTAVELIVDIHPPITL